MAQDDFTICLLGCEVGSNVTVEVLSMEENVVSPALVKQNEF